MPAITIPPWQAALSRWGDTIFALALLLTDDQVEAEQTTVAVFARSLRIDAAAPESILFRTLLNEHSRRFQLRSLRPQRLRRHILPQPLIRIDAYDRVLLSLWLLHGVTGPQLASLTQITQPALAKRLASALAKLTDDAGDFEHTERTAFTLWITQLLSQEATPSTTFGQLPMDEAQQAHRWIPLVETARSTLRVAVGHRRLPLTCADVIAAEAYALEDEPTRWWQQQRVWLVALLGAVITVLLLLIKPWNTGTPTAADPPPTAAEIVQTTLAAWPDGPASGALHRRVWAINPIRPDDEPLITDVWLAADSTRHRVEVRRGNRLVEWQLADGRRRFEYAGDPAYSSCQWGDPTPLDRLVRSFEISTEQVAAARDARLTLGAYGFGYHALKQALAAQDLHSFGTRVDGDSALLTLGYTDTASLGKRQILLWIDPQAKELRLVQEVSQIGGQSAGRDLWRLETSDELKGGVPLSKPEWNRSTQQRDTLVDPACPGLDTTRVIDLRSLLGAPASWSRYFIPATLPPGMTRAALLSTNTIASQINSFEGIRTIVVGPGRWLRLVSAPSIPNNGSGEQRGDWQVVFDEHASMVSGTACRLESDGQLCLPLIGFSARGLTRDDILAMVETLKPIDAQLWQQQDQFFLDPQPLAPHVMEVLMRALEAQTPPSTGGLHLATEWSARVPRQRPVQNDPYHVPFAIRFPERLLQEQWFAYSNSQVVQYKDLRTLPNSMVISVQTDDGTQVNEYSQAHGVVYRRAKPDNTWWFHPPVTPVEEIIKHLLNSPEPITLKELDGVIQLAQMQHINIQPNDNVALGAHLDPFVGPLVPWLGNLPQGSYMFRVWLNDATYLPIKAETVFVDQQGNETPLVHAAITEWQNESRSGSSVFSLPELPGDTIVVDQATTTRVNTSANEDDLLRMERVLMGKESDGFTILSDTGPGGRINPQLRDGPGIEQVLYTPLQQLDQFGLLRITTYALPDAQTKLVVRQGPRILLRHALRHHPILEENEAMWDTSTSIPVTIDGKGQTAWLLQDSLGDTVLVVEVDDILLHISSTDHDHLRAAVPQLLSQLSWVDIAD